MNNFSAKHSLFLISFGVIIGLLMGGLIWIVSSPPRGKPVALATRPSDQLIRVYISGEVVNPGVYQIPIGSRVIDAVEIAGGFLSSADVALINQAALVTDSSHLNILPLMTRGNLQSSAININIATEAELESLPGIGPVSAKSIIDYRLENGPFRAIEEIQKVAVVIGPITFDNIKHLISIGE